MTPLSGQSPQVPGAFPQQTPISLAVELAKAAPEAWDAEMVELEAEMRQHYGTQLLHSFQLDNYQSSPADDAEETRLKLLSDMDTHNDFESRNGHIHGDKLLFPPTSPNQATTGFPFTSPQQGGRSVATHLPLHSPQLRLSTPSTPSHSFYDISESVAANSSSSSPLASSTPLHNILTHVTSQDLTSLLRPADVPLHHELSAPLSSSSSTMSTFTPEQFSALLLTIARLADGDSHPRERSWKSSNYPIFWPDMPREHGGRARSVVINGQTAFRCVYAFTAEISIVSNVIGHRLLTRNLQSQLRGSAATWYRDVLSQERRLALLNDPETELTKTAPVQLWIDTLIEQFGTEEDDPFATLVENKFTTERLK